MTSRRDDSGQTTMLIVTLAVVLMMTIAVVVDASAAYLHRQGLANVAEGAALYAADSAASGTDIYTGGLGEELALDDAAARAAVAEYLHSTGASARYPSLRYDVHVDRGTHRVLVDVRAPVELPLRFPGTPETAQVSAHGNATVIVDQDG